MLLLASFIDKFVSVPVLKLWNEEDCPYYHARITNVSEKPIEPFLQFEKGTQNQNYLGVIFISMRII